MLSCRLRPSPTLPRSWDINVLNKGLLKRLVNVPTTLKWGNSTLRGWGSIKHTLSKLTHTLTTKITRLHRDWKCRFSQNLSNNLWTTMWTKCLHSPPVTYIQAKVKVATATITCTKWPTHPEIQYSCQLITSSLPMFVADIQVFTNLVNPKKIVPQDLDRMSLSSPPQGNMGHRGFTSIAGQLLFHPFYL